MKIGLYGDSFAYQQRPGPIWFKLLEAHGHDVFSYGEPGSSLLFSAKLLLKHHQDYDFNIWCLTMPGRWSFVDPENPGRWIHSTNFTTQKQIALAHYEISKQLIACQDYRKWVFNWEDERLLGQGLVKLIQSEVDNLMIIPCFPWPLTVKFNLFTISQREFDTMFPNQDSHEVFKKYQDQRLAHLSLANNRRLASLIANELVPGIFQTSYDNFVFNDFTKDEIINSYDIQSH